MREYKACLAGVWPPHQPRNLRGYVRLMRHARRGHALVRQVLKASRQDAMVSIAFAIWPLQPVRRWSPIDQAMARLGDWLWQGRIMRRTPPALDWIGGNYYSHTIPGSPWPHNPPPPSGQTGFSLEGYSQGFYYV